MSAKARKHIAIRAVKALKPGEAVRDNEVRGFGCRRQRDARVYFLRTRYRGKREYFTIGEHGSPWTPEKARDEAKRILGDIAAGKDSALAREAERTAPDIREACRAVFPGARGSKTEAADGDGIPGAFGPVHPAGTGAYPGTGRDPRGRGAAPSLHAGDAAAGEPRPCRAVQAVQLGRKIRLSPGRLQPMPARGALPPRAGANASCRKPNLRTLPKRWRKPSGRAPSRPTSLPPCGSWCSRARAFRKC